MLGAGILTVACTVVDCSPRNTNKQSKLEASGECGTIRRMISDRSRLSRFSRSRWLWRLCLPVVSVVLSVVPTPCLAQSDGSSAERIPKRIITIAPNAAEIICALGACDRIVGASKYCVYPPELKHKPLVGGFIDPDLEKIITLRPDLVVLRGRSEAIESLCRRHGIDLYRDDTETLADITRTVLDLGNRLGLTEEADSLAKKMHDQLAAIRRRVAGRKKPRVFLTTMRQPDRLADLLTAGRGMFLGELVEVAGGVNVFGDLDLRYPQVSLEAILAKRPEVIIELMPEVTMTPALDRQMRHQWAKYSAIPAIAQGRLHFITDNNSLIPSPRIVGVIEKISRILHPEDGVGP